MLVKKYCSNLNCSYTELVEEDEVKGCWQCSGELVSKEEHDGIYEAAHAGYSLDKLTPEQKIMLEIIQHAFDKEAEMSVAGMFVFIMELNRPVIMLNFLKSVLLCCQGKKIEDVKFDDMPKDYKYGRDYREFEEIYERWERFAFPERAE